MMLKRFLFSQDVPRIQPSILSTFGFPQEGHYFEEFFITSLGFHWGLDDLWAT